MNDFLDLEFALPSPSKTDFFIDLVSFLNDNFESLIS